MPFDPSILQPRERAVFALRALYQGAGCRMYHMGQFEEYALYQENQSFLPSRQVITFTDLDGRLLALKPDVTLSIAKSARPAPGQTLRFYYSENVYRPSAESGAFKEIPQTGVECIGRVGGVEVLATLDGVLRGIIRQGYPVTKGLKIADIDPRMEQIANCDTVSDKARAIAGGVVEALLFLAEERGIPLL